MYSTKDNNYGLQVLSHLLIHTFFENFMQNRYSPQKNAHTKIRIKFQVSVDPLRHKSGSVFFLFSFPFFLSLGEVGWGWCKTKSKILRNQVNSLLKIAYNDQECLSQEVERKYVNKIHYIKRTKNISKQTENQ